MRFGISAKHQALDELGVSGLAPGWILEKQIQLTPTLSRLPTAEPIPPDHVGNLAPVRLGYGHHHCKPLLWSDLFFNHQFHV